MNNSSLPSNNKSSNNNQPAFINPSMLNGATSQMIPGPNMIPSFPAFANQQPFNPPFYNGGPQMPMDPSMMSQMPFNSLSNPVGAHPFYMPQPSVGHQFSFPPNTKPPHIPAQNISISGNNQNPLQNSLISDGKSSQPSSAQIQPAAENSSKVEPSGAKIAAEINKNVENEKKEKTTPAAISEKRALEINSEPRVAGKWIEYRTDEGHFYYYDSSTEKTQWEKPSEFDSLLKKPKIDNNTNPSLLNGVSDSRQKSTFSSALKSPPANFTVLERPEEDREMDRLSAQSSFSLLSHEECVGMFEALLREQNVAHDSEWAGVLSDIIKDPRYSAVRTLSERKKIFADYCQKKRKEHETERKAELDAKKKSFNEMLSQHPGVNLRTKFSEIEKLFESDERFTSLKHVESRSLFRKYRDKLEKQKREKEDRLYKSNAPLFLDLLKNSKKVTYKSMWEDVKDQFIHEECVKNLKAMERLKIFKKHKTSLEKEHKKEREERARQQREREKNFLRLLHELSMKKTLFHSKSRWTDVLELDEFKNDSRYKEIADENEKMQEKVHKLFEKYCCDLEDKLDEEKALLKKFLRSKMRRVSVDDTVEELIKLKEDKEFPKIKTDHAKSILLEMIAKAKHKQSRKKKKN